MNIVLAASEAFPFCKTGGLADVVGALCQQFASRKGNKVLLFLPHYRDVVRVSSLKVVPGVYLIPIGDRIEQVSLSYINWGNVLVFFVGNRKYFDRPDLYRTRSGEYADNDERFILFSRAVLEGCKFIGFRPDLIHCHDWQTGLIPVYLKTEFQANPFFWNMKSIMTIHNLKFQGVWDVKTLQGLSGLPMDLFTPDKLEFNKTGNILKGGLVYADYITTVSGTYADERGNVTLERECSTCEATAIAQAAKNCGGKVVVQVEKVVQDVDPRLVKIPGIYVDALVVAEAPEDQSQCQGTPGYDPAMTGEIRLPLGALEYPKMSAKKIMGRRAAMELEADKVVNLGIGAPEYVSMVASEEGIGDYMTLTVESGPVGGVPQGGNKFGGSINVEAILDQPYQFDFYDGGGVDLAFLGLAECDKKGNINVSKFGPRLAGCGGFINITQNAKKVFFIGTFTAGGLKVHCEDGKLVIDQEGKQKKLIDTVQQITFSGEYAIKTGQPVMYITERAVFELKEDGIHLTEVAPGIDVQTQVLDLMDFAPIIPEGGPKLMDERIFKDEVMGLGK